MKAAKVKLERAWAHAKGILTSGRQWRGGNYGATVLVTHTRATIIDELLERHFIAAGAAAPPVMVRSLWNETVAIAESENRDIDDVGLEAVLCAVVPERWDRAAATAMDGCRQSTRLVSSVDVDV